ncbi:alpha/beta hydrolase family protein [Streptomyces sp. NBC_01795]|nr:MULTISPECIES: alpha/beta hydrolase [unclassified Streptomyces]WSA97346.1 alpha/beta hydrolase family protein [Streptomyces sp. NBC_01795]WSB81776.1 alpha/beta hydrolase family protein [Streptomyces sp. NBC_01775]WSS17461.1 alpha/beta hydrolase family protein [Streptomyces sp. NBC_01186]WSS46208.1 alpha/beta hydrolase family protein [Streptomyces sp. NBC_01187]
MSGNGFPSTGVPGTTAWRALLALAVVFVLLATTGWTAIRKHDLASGPRAAALMAWEKGSFAGHPLPDPDESAGRIARYFKRLDAAQQRTLAQRYPLVVGNLGGAPVELRYQANRTALLKARDTERDRMTDQRLTDEGRQDAGHRMHRFESMLRPGRQILAFDPTGRGRAAEVFGDLERAQRVSVVVPGVDTELLTFEKSSLPYSAPVGMAKSLQHQQHATAPYTRTATIAWADYTAPVGLGVDAASGGPAKDGAERLDSFIRTLPAATRAASGGASGEAASPKISLFCHSYGSVVCGVAAHRMPDDVTDIAVSGSPGMRADNAAQLGTSAHIWAMRDRDDWIADVPHMNVGGLGHGADPVSDGFGARHLSAAGSIGHTGYFAPHTQSLANFAAIGTGSYTDVGCDSSDPECSAVP